jgi:hypothetical protein
MVAIVSTARAAFRARSCLISPGWWRSRWTRRPVDARGNPLPWLTYDAISMLERCVKPGMAVFEYGAGHSTLWWLSKGCSVITCESDPTWAQEIAERAPGSDIRLRPLEDGSYVNELSKYPGVFDIVVVDGFERVACAALAPAALNGQGIILFDNSDVSEYEPGLSLLTRQGFRRRDFAGFGPVNGYSWMTSIFYRDGNCLGL